MFHPLRLEPPPVDSNGAQGYIRVFPRRTKWTPTDELAFVGDPPLFRPPMMPVKVSATFSWDVEEAKRLAYAWSAHYSNVSLGGPAFGDPGGDFTPGLFLKEGVTITSRGCPRKCPWCFVPKREKEIRELPIRDGHIIQDNNLLGCSQPHIEAVFEMVRRQRKAAIFSGGIDAGLLRKWHRTLFDSIRIRELWFACDTPGAIKALERVYGIVEGIPQRKLRCYVMIGHGDETLKEAEKRLERVYHLGFDPFCQLYRGPGEREYGKNWKALNKKWCRPAAYKSAMESTG